MQSRYLLSPAALRFVLQSDVKEFIQSHSRGGVSLCHNRIRDRQQI